MPKSCGSASATTQPLRRRCRSCRVPSDDSHTVEDYEFRFDQPESPVILDASGGGLLTGKCYYQWKNQQAIQLTNDLFDNDSFCMAGLRTRTLGIYEKDTGRSIVCDVAGFPYTLIWSALSKPVRFVCIEPWNSLPPSVNGPQGYFPGDGSAGVGAACCCGLPRPGRGVEHDPQHDLQPLNCKQKGRRPGGVPPSFCAIKFTEP